MATMFKETAGDGSSKMVNIDALRSEVRAALINQKVNACPITMRHAWHMSGTFDKTNNTGGSDGATIRFSPEKDDGANAGLHIIRDLLAPVKRNHPEISYADLYVIASAMAIEFTGGPAIDVNLGRTDKADGATCPANGRLPDASQGAAHLRDVFGRMGFNDQEIVALSGGHSLGSCHRVRSGFSGQWTTKPLKFDNEYFQNLLNETWTEKVWEGPRQFTNAGGNLMMLPTDMALVEDSSFRRTVELYARDAAAFNADFALAYGKLVALGCPAHCKEAPKKNAAPCSNQQFRHHVMHGDVPEAKALLNRTNVHTNVDPTSGRTPLHFAAFWGHKGMVSFLIGECGVKTDHWDFNGDTPLMDAASHGHAAVVELLVNAGANISTRNRQNKTALDIAGEAEYPECAAIIKGAVSRRASNL
jgi:catalase (peroxidase I)